MNLLLGVLPAIAIIHFHGAQASFPGFLCPDPPTTPVPTLIPCDYDCITNHGAGLGTCSNDGFYNCKWSGTKTTPNCCTYSYPFLMLPIVCQCAVKSTDPVLIQAYYTAICENDCKCNHAAAGGACNWFDYDGPDADLLHQQCICNYPPNFVWTSAICPFQGGFDVLTAILKLY